MITDKCDSFMVCRDQGRLPFLVLQIGLSVTSAGDEGPSGVGRHDACSDAVRVKSVLGDGWRSGPLQHHF